MLTLTNRARRSSLCIWKHNTELVTAIATLKLYIKKLISLCQWHQCMRLGLISRDGECDLSVTVTSSIWHLNVIITVCSITLAFFWKHIIIHTYTSFQQRLLCAEIKNATLNVSRFLSTNHKRFESGAAKACVLELWFHWSACHHRRRWLVDLVLPGLRRNQLWGQHTFSSRW